MTRPLRLDGVFALAALASAVWIAAAPPSTAQVVVTDTVEVAAPRATAGPIVARSMAVSAATASEAGSVRVRYVSARRANPLGTGDVLAVTPTGGETTEGAVVDGFASPIELPVCEGTAYHYGEGPFDWDAPNDAGSVDDAYVFSLSCSSRYGQERGLCETSPGGSRSDLRASAWTYLGSPGTFRSFLRFDLSGFTAPVDATAAELRLFPHGESQSSLSGSNAFSAAVVTSSWSEGGVRWSNQPSAGGPVAAGAGGSGPRSLDVTAALQGWLSGSAPNYGFRLSLDTESYYRRQSFSSSEGPTPPELSVTFENPDGTGETADFGAVGEGETYTVRYNGAGPSEITSGQLEVDGEPHDGFFHTFKTGSGCGREELRVFSFTVPSGLTFAKGDGSEVDPAAYLPEKDDLVTTTATFAGASGGTVRFELVDPYEFAFADGTTAPKEVALGDDGTADVVVKSVQWWGVTTVKATYTPAEGAPVTLEQQLPVDTDGDTIADVWEMLPANGGRLDLGGNKDDRDWDEDDGISGSAPGTPGDGIRKEDEYRGALVDGTHVRLSAKERELFMNPSSSTEVSAITSALSGVEVKTITFGTLKFHSKRDAAKKPLSRPVRLFPENNAVEPTVLSFPLTRGRLIKNGVAVSHPPGARTVFGYAFPQVSKSALYPRYSEEYRTWQPQTYDGTVDNMYNFNSVPESAATSPSSPLGLGVPVTAGVETWVVVFDGTDLDGNGVLNNVNPYDGIAFQPSPPPPYTSALNDSFDGIIATKSQAGTVQATSVHEVGHTIFGGGHPATGTGAMRSSIGPAKIATYQVWRGMVNLKTLSP